MAKDGVRKEALQCESMGASWNCMDLHSHLVVVLHVQALGRGRGILLLQHILGHSALRSDSGESHDPESMQSCSFVQEGTTDGILGFIGGFSFWAGLADCLLFLSTVSFLAGLANSFSTT